jgi:hypothetical protein
MTDAPRPTARTRCSRWSRVIGGAVAVLTLLGPLVGCASGDDDIAETAATGTEAPAAPTAAASTTPAAEATAAPDAASPTPADATTPSPTATFEASGEVAFGADSSLSTVGLDDVFFGMTIEEASRAADAEFTLPDEQPTCYSITPTAGPEGLFFTVVDGRIERVDITNPAIRTRSGAGVGSSEVELADLFGDRLVTTPVDGGRRIEFVPEDEADATHRIVFMTDGTTVVSMRGGRQEIVESDIPCGA